MADLRTNGAPFRTQPDTDDTPILNLVPTAGYGVNAAGEPYYDPDGAVADEEAYLGVDSTGAPFLITFGVGG